MLGLTSLPTFFFVFSAKNTTQLIIKMYMCSILAISPGIIYPLPIMLCVMCHFQMTISVNIHVNSVIKLYFVIIFISASVGLGIAWKLVSMFCINVNTDTEKIFFQCLTLSNIKSFHETLQLINNRNFYYESYYEIMNLTRLSVQSFIICQRHFGGDQQSWRW